MKRVLCANSFHLVLRNNVFVCEPLSSSQKVRKPQGVVLYARRPAFIVLTRSLYVKSNNCFELCKGMEMIKAHFCE